MCGDSDHVIDELTDDITDLQRRLTLLKMKCQEYIADCCAEDVGRCCDNYGCSTLQDFLDILK